MKGWEVEAAITADFLWNVSGGTREDEAILGNLDLTAALDTAEAGLWDAGSFFFYVLGNADNGRTATELVGDIQATSNIEADETIKLYEAWYEHSFRDGQLRLLAGLHDYNSEFDVLEHASLFINSSFGISPDISQAGPSIFPTTAAGLRARVAIGPDGYALAAIYDGVPGDPDDVRGTHIRFDSGDGVFGAIEAGCVHGEPGDGGYRKYAAGAWYLTADAEDVSGESVDSNGGLYFIAECDLSDRTAVFGQFGVAEEDRNQVAWYTGTGVTCAGVVPGRENDMVGIAVAIAGIGGDFRDANPGLDSTETAIELTWLAELSPHLAIQPDIQYVVHPAQEPGIDDALIVGVRATYTF